jgi:hypothetical protein
MHIGKKRITPFKSGSKIINPGQSTLFQLTSLQFHPEYLLQRISSIQALSAKASTLSKGKILPYRSG